MREKDLNGKVVAGEFQKALKERIARFESSTGLKLGLVMVQVGDDPSAASYVRSKKRTCEKMGILNRHISLPASASLEELQKKIEELNLEPSVNGIILELPLPQHIPYIQAVSLIEPKKDVDCLHPANLGLLFAGHPRFVPNTPQAVMRLLEYYQVELSGKKAVIIGRSLAVGKPLYSLMLSKNATVVNCHSKTGNLMAEASTADILVVAVGKPKLVGKDYVKEGAVVVDVGINATDEGLVGDVDYEEVYEKASLITPVPGGVGPLTVAEILENTLKAAIYQNQRPVFDGSLHVVNK